MEEMQLLSLFPIEATKTTGRLWAWSRRSKLRSIRWELRNTPVHLGRDLHQKLLLLDSYFICILCNLPKYLKVTVLTTSQILKDSPRPFAGGVAECWHRHVGLFTSVQCSLVAFGGSSPDWSVPLRGCGWGQLLQHPPRPVALQRLGRIAFHKLPQTSQVFNLSIKDRTVQRCRWFSINGDKWHRYPEVPSCCCTQVLLHEGLWRNKS